MGRALHDIQLGYSNWKQGNQTNLVTNIYSHHLQLGQVVTPLFSFQIILNFAVAQHLPPALFFSILCSAFSVFVKICLGKFLILDTHICIQFLHHCLLVSRCIHVYAENCNWTLNGYSKNCRNGMALKQILHGITGSTQCWFPVTQRTIFFWCVGQGCLGCMCNLHKYSTD